MTTDMGQNNRRYGRIVFYIPEKGMRRKGGKIVGEEKYLEEKKTEKEKEENIWSTLLLFVTTISNPQLNDCTLTVGS